MFTPHRNDGGTSREDFSSLLAVFFTNGLGNRAQLHVRRSFVDCADFTIAIEFFLREIFGETDSAHPIDALNCSCLSHFGRVVFCHGCFLHERFASFHQSSRIVRKQTGAFNLRSNGRHLMLHRLEVIDLLTELLTFQQIWQCGIEAALCQTNHLGADANTTLVQIGCSVFVSMPDLTENAVFVYADIVEVKHACAGRTNAQLIFLFADGESGRIAIDDEGCDAFVTLEKFRLFNKKWNLNLRAQLTSDGSTFAINKNTSDTSELLIHIFVPFIT